ncbi:hypothetical protein HELRODRAFT_183512 [Helobdella robusta]|uniref:Uncharacterized protein n=1 Tax=Helobdella robusta TaxID=6412 RepID=T1FJR9_HELRO|nr:hypothetical protein HELRODRAFT_183512 [Helobdella robusta]ESO11125.1 hypothetical protein HELRODRAFT_183512 [Helobdella robusta]
MSVEECLGSTITSLSQISEFSLHSSLGANSQTGKELNLMPNKAGELKCPDSTYGTLCDFKTFSTRDNNPLHIYSVIILWSVDSRTNLADLKLDVIVGRPEELCKKLLENECYKRYNVSSEINLGGLYRKNSSYLLSAKTSDVVCYTTDCNKVHLQNTEHPLTVVDGKAIETLHFQLPISLQVLNNTLSQILFSCNIEVWHDASRLLKTPLQFFLQGSNGNNEILKELNKLTLFL